MKKYLLIALSLLACFFSTSFAVNNTVSIKLLWNGLVIGTPWAVNLWTANPWQDITYTFSWNNYFWIRDLRWLSQWHYTTIQCDWLYSTDWAYIITWVIFKAGELILSWWLANETKIDNELFGWLDITEPKLYFYRNDNWHSSGVTNRYINYPTIIVPLPQNVQTWIYRWKITYTLYDTSFSY